LARTQRRVFFISVANFYAHRNFVDSIIDPVDTSGIPPHSVLPTYDELCIWGLQEHGANPRIWQLMNKNDILFFYKNKKYVCAAIVEGKEYYPFVANGILWAPDPESSLQNRGFLVYMLPSNVVHHEVSSTAINRLFGYMRGGWLNDTGQAFHVDDSRVSGVEKKFGSLENALEKFDITFPKHKQIPKEKFEQKKSFGIKNVGGKKFPSCRFVIDTGDSIKDADIGTEFLAETTAELAKMNVPYKMNVRSGSFELFYEILQQITTNPTGAAIIGSAIGIIMGRYFLHKKNISKQEFNDEWYQGMVFHQHVIVRRLSYASIKSFQNSSKEVQVIIVDDSEKEYKYVIDKKENTVKF